MTPQGLAIGNRVRAVMNERDLSQVDLGKESGVGTNFINRLLLGFFKEPSSVKMARVARALNTTVEELVIGQPPHTDLVRTPETHISFFHRLSRIPAHYVDEATELAWLHWSRERRLAQQRGGDRPDEDAGEQDDSHFGGDESRA